MSLNLAAPISVSYRETSSYKYGTSIFSPAHSSQHVLPRTRLSRVFDQTHPLKPQWSSNRIRQRPSSQTDIAILQGVGLAEVENDGLIGQQYCRVRIRRVSDGSVWWESPERKRSDYLDGCFCVTSDGRVALSNGMNLHIYKVPLVLGSQTCAADIIMA